MIVNHWRAADGLAARLGMGARVRKSIEQTFERWDGAGVPHGVRGPDILLTSQLVNLADVVEVFHRSGGVASAVDVARRRSGTQFAPDSVELFCEAADEVLGDLGENTSWELACAAEPTPPIRIRGAEFDGALEAIADFVDIKSPYTVGHSRAVAGLAAAAARQLGLPAAETAALRRAGLIHDLGRLGVSSAIWDKRGALTETEAERVRMHPYLTQRMASFSPVLAPLAAVAVQHHERLDRSGYPFGLGGNDLGTASRILAAADTYRAWREPRPHRPAGSAEAVARRLRDEAREERLDGAAVDAVLRSAGHAVGVRCAWPEGLTAREVQVLRLLARRMSNRGIAGELVISRKTVGNHIEHIYAKIGVSNRALASLFASAHGLMADEAAEDPRYAGGAD